MQGYGFVDFESPTSALAAVHELQGQGIQVMMVIMKQFSTTLDLVSFFCCCHFGHFGHFGHLGLYGHFGHLGPFWPYHAGLTWANRVKPVLQFIVRGRFCSNCDVFWIKSL